MSDSISLLTTISAASASFVAILGGLIAQKLIEINNDRTALTEQLSILEKRNADLEEDTRIIIEDLEEKAAIEFISYHTLSLANGDSFADAFNNNPTATDDLYVLDKYWNRALEIRKYYLLNACYSFAEIVKICRIALDELEYYEDIDESEENMYDFCRIVCEILHSAYSRYGMVNGKALPTAVESDDEQFLWYAKDRNELISRRNQNYKEIKDIEKNIDEYKSKLIGLKDPANVKSGLFIMCAFVITCVIAPLFMVLAANDQTIIWFVKIAVVLFTVGVLSVIRYLFNLLRGKSELNIPPGGSHLVR